MTEYQKIEKELTRLGWMPTQGKGDHIKFIREDNKVPIIVSRSVTDTSRALLNQYAQIRKIEPEFTLGKQNIVLPKESKPSKPETPSRPEDVPSWADFRATVRWTAPEQKDYSKLSDRDSVMNRQYKVIDFPEKTGDTQLILISDGHAAPFLVSLDDLDAWELKTCSGCGKQIPMNRLEEKNGEMFCQDCRTKLAEKSKTMSEKAKNNEEDNSLDTLLNELEITEREFIKPYSGLLISQMPDDVKAKILDKLKGTFEKLPAKARRNLSRKYPDIWNYVMDKEPETIQRKKRHTPYQAWKNFLTNVVNEYITLNLNCPGKNDINKVNAHYFKSTYRINKLKNRADKSFINVIEITTFDYDVTLDIWSHNGALFSEFSEVFNEEPFCVLLINQKEGIREYLVDTWKKNGPQDYELLKSLTDDESSFNRIKHDLELPPGSAVYAMANKWVESAAYSPEADNIISVNLEFRTEDEAEFETAKSYYRILITVDDRIVGRGPYEKLLQSQEELLESIHGCPCVIGLSLSSEYDGIYHFHKTEFFGNRFDEAEKQPQEKKGTASDSEKACQKESFGMRPGETLLKIVKQDGDDYTISFPSLTTRQEKEYQKRLSDAIKQTFVQEMKTGAIITPSLINGIADFMKSELDKYPDTREVYRKLIIKKFDLSMNTPANTLDNNNPLSENQTAGALTTRELLKELKSRGYVWEKLRQTITIDVDDEDI